MSREKTESGASPVENLDYIINSDGKPFETEKEARAAMKKKGIRIYTLCRMEEGGFKVIPEKYWRVKFQAKSNPNDSEDVQLSVNGETLIIAREREVIIPDRFKECADHGVYPQFRQLPNQPRKIIGRIKTFPYDTIGPATESEYFKAKAEGTRKTIETVNRYGHDVDPDTLSNDMAAG
jgi:hypothetical protein